MDYQSIVESVEGLRWLSPAQGKVLYDFVLEKEVNNILELGFYHGLSAMYMAGALQKRDASGKVTTIDKVSSKELNPNIEALSEKLGLTEFIEPIYAHNCYTWELGKLLEVEPRPKFDLFFIDGAHLWKTDALAFFLSDKLLAENGWIIFDDLMWAMARDSDPNNNRWTKSFSDEERNSKQVLKVFELIVKEHPNYGHFKTEDGWGYAQKLGPDHVNAVKESTSVKTVMVTKEMFKKSMRR